MQALRSVVLTICLLLFGASAGAYNHWNDFRQSALLPGSTIAVRIENPTGPGVENRVIYTGSGIVEDVMTSVLDGPSTLTATVPGPVTSLRRYGFRLLQGTELDFVPVRIGDGVSPTPGDLTRVAEDPSGDHLYGFINLDLVDCHVSFSGDRLYASLTNAGGGFPVVSGLTFFGYLLGVSDPARSDPDTVFGLMQTYNQPGIISPGLYKITGSGLGNLVKIGDVVVQEFPAVNTLMISCRLADLMADSYFMSWYNPADPAIGVAGFTQRITLLTGAKEADRSPGGRCYLREFTVAPETNLLPGLSNFLLQGAGASAIAAIDYLDANPNCPVLAQIVFDDTLAFPMYPQTLDYGSVVVYQTLAGIEPLANDSWTRAVVRFSDDLANVVEYVPLVNGVPGTHAGDTEQSGSGALRVSIAPSPFRAHTAVGFVAPAPGSVRVDVYDAHGGLVRSLAEDVAPAGPFRVEWDGRDAAGLKAPPGIYFCRVSAGGQTETHKVVAIR